jgi:hypothetical protein
MNLSEEIKTPYCAPPTEARVWARASRKPDTNAVAAASSACLLEKTENDVIDRPEIKTMMATATNISIIVNPFITSY